MKTIISLLHKNLHIFRYGTHLRSANHQKFPRRNLITQESLKINSFNQFRENRSTMVNDVDAFKEEMKTKCGHEVSHLIFVDDIKNMMGVAKTDDDLQLLNIMIKKYLSQNNIIIFGSYKVGPEVLRLYYLLNKPNEALKLLKNPETCNFFSEITSFIILGELLFKNQMYEGVLDMVDIFINEQFSRIKYPPLLITLYYASCYKLNTPESFEKAKALWNTFDQVGFLCPMRGVWLYSCLAVKQNDPDLALEILSKPKQTCVGNNIKLLALIAKKQYKEVIDFIANMIFHDVPQVNNFITSDTHAFITNEFYKFEEHLMEFKRLTKHLEDHNMISNIDLESLLLEEVEYGKNSKNFKRKNS